MGRPPIGIRAMTATERHQRWLDRQRNSGRDGPCPTCARLQGEVNALRAELDTLKATPSHSVETEQPGPAGDARLAKEHAKLQRATTSSSGSRTTSSRTRRATSPREPESFSKTACRS